MNWVELGAIGELVGGVAVIASLIFVGLQVRQNSNWLRASVVDTSSQRLTDMHYFMASEGNAAILRAIADGVEPVDPDLTMRVGQAYMAIARNGESAYFQFQRGYLPEQLWNGYETHIHIIASTRFFGPWWRVRKSMFHEAFRDHVDALLDREHLDVGRIENPIADE